MHRTRFDHENTREPPVLLFLRLLLSSPLASSLHKTYYVPFQVTFLLVSLSLSFSLCLERYLSVCRGYRQQQQRHSKINCLSFDPTRFLVIRASPITIADYPPLRAFSWIPALFNRSIHIKTNWSLLARPRFGFSIGEVQFCTVIVIKNWLNRS